MASNQITHALIVKQQTIAVKITNNNIGERITRSIAKRILTKYKWKSKL